MTKPACPEAGALERRYLRGVADGTRDAWLNEVERNRRDRIVKYIAQIHKEIMRSEKRIKELKQCGADLTAFVRRIDGFRQNEKEKP